MSKAKMDMKICFPVVAAFGVIALTGCAKPFVDDAVPPPIKNTKLYVPDVDAGSKVAFDNKSIFVEAAEHPFVARTDPFALNASQLAFERAQEKERVFQELGQFYPPIAPPEPQEVVPVLEPQPYRRLAGVVVGQSVIGIIELNGSEQTLIRPGMLVPGTEWRVVSIDTDKAVLRRSGNKLPHEITVRLESRPFGTGGGTGPAPGGGRSTGGNGGGGGPQNPGAPTSG